MEKTDVIICKVSGWFIWRATLMTLMFLVFGAYFFYDGKVGYKKQNAEYYAYSAKSEVKWALEAAKVEKANVEKAVRDGKVEEVELLSPARSESTWQAFIDQHQVRLFEKKDNNKSTLITDVEGCFPQGYVFPQTIPAVFAQRYDELVNDPAMVEQIWSQYAAEQGWNESCPDAFKNRQVIESQFNWAIGAGLLGAVALFYLLRNLFRDMRVDGVAYKAPNGEVVPFASIFKIDKRKWNTKGLAFLHFRDGNGKERRSRIDGMVYGQFDMSKRNNAEALYRQIESSVENVELVDYDEEREEKPSLANNEDSEAVIPENGKNCDPVS